MWLTLQLTEWALKTIKTEDLISEISKRLKTNRVSVFYPCLEDVKGKHLTSYSEYIFLQYIPTLEAEYSSLEGTEFFRNFMRSGGRFQMLSDEEMQHLRISCFKQVGLSVGAKVKILDGPYKGNIGIVLDDSDEGHVTLKIVMGLVESEAVIPKHWCRKLKEK